MRWELLRRLAVDGVGVRAVWSSGEDESRDGNDEEDDRR